MHLEQQDGTLPMISENIDPNLLYIISYQFVIYLH
jgi:hypothetical protein